MKARKITMAIIGIIMFIAAIFNIITFSLSAANYNKNKLLWDDDTKLITWQRSAQVKNLKFGFETIGNAGCGPVAVYNIMYEENRKVPLPEIIKHMDNCFFGILGTTQYKVINYLQSQGFSCSIHSDTSKFEELALESDYSIYVYWGIKDGKPIGHFTLLIPSTKYSTFQVINGGNGFMTMQQLIDKNKEYTINNLITVAKPKNS